GEKWFVIYRAGPNGEKGEIVPVFSEEGKRLSYHFSDMIYYGNTLAWRRASIPITDWTNEVPEKIFQSVERLCRFDFNLQGLRGKQKYLVFFYQDQSMNMD